MSMKARIGVALGALFVSCAALAGEAALSWELPTQNTDGTAIPATGPDALNHVRAEWFACTSSTQAWPTTPVSAQIAYPGTSYTVTNLPAGLWCFRVFAVNNAGAESSPSGVGTKQIAPSVPNPPVLTVTQDVAYYLIMQENRYVLLPVGTVAVGTACDETQSVLGHYVVPRASVTWYGTVRPQAVVARCG